jgi:hypothetical protein
MPAGCGLEEDLSGNLEKSFTTQCKEIDAGYFCLPPFLLPFLFFRDVNAADPMPGMMAA